MNKKATVGPSDGSASVAGGPVRQSRRRHLLAGAVAAALAVGIPWLVRAESKAAPAPGTDGAPAIGSDRQLFADDRLVDRALTRDVTRTMNPPQDIRRVLKPDQPWETLALRERLPCVDYLGQGEDAHTQR